MASCHHRPVLSCKTVHFHIKDSRALNLLISHSCLFISFFNVKCHPGILYLLGNSITPPKGIAIWLLCQRHQPHTEYAVTWIGLDSISQLCESSPPTCRTVLLLDTKLPPLGALLHLLFPIDNIITIRALNCMFIQLVLYNGFQQLILITLTMPHCAYMFSATITFAEYSASAPSWNSSIYGWESMIGLGFAIPMAFPKSSSFLLLTQTAVVTCAGFLSEGLVLPLCNCCRHHQGGHFNLEQSSVLVRHPCTIPGCGVC